MKIKTEKLLYILLSFILAAVFMFFFSGTIMGGISGLLMSVIGIYLGIDMKAMTSASSVKKKTDFEPANRYKYYICFIGFLGLFLEGKYLTYSQEGLDLGMAMGFYASGMLIVIGVLVGGLEANKISAQVGGSE